MDDEKRRLRDEVAELAEAVRELRGQLAHQHCNHPQCCHAHYVPCPGVHWYPSYPLTYQPYTVTICGSSGNVSAIDSGTVTYANGVANYS